MSISRLLELYGVISIKSAIFRNAVLQCYLMVIKYLKILLSILRTLWQISFTLALGLTTFFLIGYVQIWFDEQVAMFEKWHGIEQLQGGIFDALYLVPSSYYVMPNCWELLTQSIWIGVGCALVCLPIISFMYSIRQKQLKIYR